MFAYRSLCKNLPDDILMSEVSAFTMESVQKSFNELVRSIVEHGDYFEKSKKLVEKDTNVYASVSILTTTTA